MIGKIVQFYKPYSKYENNTPILLTGVIKDKFLGLIDINNQVSDNTSSQGQNIKTKIAIDYYLIVSGKYTYNIPCRDITPIITINADEARKISDSNKQYSLEKILYCINEKLLVEKFEYYTINFNKDRISPSVIEELEKLGYTVTKYPTVFEISWKPL